MTTLPTLDPDSKLEVFISLDVGVQRDDVSLLRKSLPSLQSVTLWSMLVSPVPRAAHSVNKSLCLILNVISHLEFHSALYQNKVEKSYENAFHLVWIQLHSSKTAFDVHAFCWWWEGKQTAISKLLWSWFSWNALCKTLPTKTTEFLFIYPQTLEDVRLLKHYFSLRTVCCGPFPVLN